MLTTAQAAKAVGITPQGIRVNIAAGRLKAVRIGDRFAITQQELDRFIKSRAA